MKTVFFAPPLKNISGGLATIYKTALNLQTLGYDVAITTAGGSAIPIGLGQWPHLPFLPLDQALDKNDIFCLPEGWPNALAIADKAQSVVYCQNWAYLLGVLPDGVTWDKLPLSFLAVSSPVAWFMQNVLGLTVQGVVPTIVDSSFFRQQEKPSTHIRVAWMPRKNRALGEQIQQIALAKLHSVKNKPKVEWVTIKDMPLEQVAETLSRCHIFLSTGFPEGFGLPPIEAMAAGCVPVGFTGFGGWEYMRQAESGIEPLEGIIPDNNNCVGNGWYTADGDVVAAGISLAKAIMHAWERSPLWQKTQKAAKNTAENYTNEAQKQALKRIWPLLIKQ